MTDTPNRRTATTARRPDCVTKTPTRAVTKTARKRK